MAFYLTGPDECEPSIDVEKYVWDPYLEEWVDADDEASAVDLPMGSTAEFLIAIHNDGTCCDIYDIWVFDVMEDSLEFVAADPPPDYLDYIPPYWYMEWYFPGPLAPCEWIYIYITAIVVAEPCHIDFNYVEVSGYVDCDPYYVYDFDWAYIHSIEPCEPSIDVEKYVWDPELEDWVDADDPGSAVDLEEGSMAEFMIAIHNDGTCCDIYDIWVLDDMEDSLEFEYADPPPDEVYYDAGYWHINWYGLGPISPCEWIYLYIYAVVVGEPCSTDSNYVFVDALCDCDPFYVWDEDFAYVHSVAVPEPDLDCDGSISFEDVEPGATVTDSFDISNIGDATLNWEIDEFPAWGTFTFDPESGALGAGDSETIDVEIVAPEEENEEFEGEIKIINSDDPDDFCIIDVSLVTPCESLAYKNTNEFSLDLFPLLNEV
jgi:hypothetical protein